MDPEIKRKIFSGRYFSTVAVVATYCFAMLFAMYLVVKKAITVEAFLGIFAGFSGTASLIIKSYFDREDRKKEEPK